MRTRHGALILAVVIVAGIGMDVGSAAGAVTERVSLSATGTQANGGSFAPAISADGRFVAFESAASNLVAGDTNRQLDVFVRDRVTGTIERVSMSSAGVQADGASGEEAISPDGRFVTFVSGASNLVAGDTNGLDDVFVRDRATGVTERVSVSSTERQANDSSFCSFGSVISADGRFVAFNSSASNLVAGDTNRRWDIFVRDRKMGTTQRVSVSSAGKQANYDSFGGTISADGRSIAFDSQASNLVAGDTNGHFDIFVRNRTTGRTRRVSVSSTGIQGNGRSREPAISADGRLVVFTSFASNLVPDDKNGKTDVFVRNRATHRTRRVSLSSGGAEANGPSNDAAISADGSLVAFRAHASNLVARDTNRRWDIFVHERATGRTRRVSVSLAGAQANGRSRWPAISADGRVVAFVSYASNLVPDDTNNQPDAFVRARSR
jgi:Tol biopolymer transport system component